MDQQEWLCSVPQFPHLLSLQSTHNSQKSPHSWGGRNPILWALKTLEGHAAAGEGDLPCGHAYGLPYTGTNSYPRAFAWRCPHSPPLILPGPKPPPPGIPLPLLTLTAPLLSDSDVGLRSPNFSLSFRGALFKP